MPQGLGATDQELIEHLRRGDERAFAAVVKEWSPLMLRLAGVHVSTQASAEEVVQETWLAVLRGLDRFEGRASLRSWVCSITVNIAKSRGVREKRSSPFSSLGPDDEGPTVDPRRFQTQRDEAPGVWKFPPAPWPDPQRAVLDAELHEVVHQSILRLPGRQRAVLELRDRHGFDSDEVCGLLGVSLGNQRILLHRARAAVRKDVEKYFAGDRVESQGGGERP